VNKYNYEIDNTIFQILQQNNTMGYNELYRSVNLKFYVSEGSFDYHIKKLLSVNLIGKKDSFIRGKPVLYFLTTEGKRQLQMKIVKIKYKHEQSNLKDDERRRIMLYFVLFVMDTWIKEYQFNRYEFDKLLSTLNLKEKELKIKEKQFDQLPFRNKKTEFGKEKRTIYNIPNKLLESIDDTYKDFFSITKLEYFSYNNKQIGPPVLDHIDEYQITYLLNEGSKPEIVYECELPGISKNDILYSDERPIFEHINFTLDEVEEIIDLAEKEGVIKALKIGNDIRYVLSNLNLRKFFEDLRDLYELLDGYILQIWLTRKPKKEEIKWMNLFIGEKNTDEIRKITYIDRHNRSKIILHNRKKLLVYNQGLGIQKYYNKLLKKYKKVKKMELPLTELLEMVYPKFLRLPNHQ
jgi:hypothetical protein